MPDEVRELCRLADISSKSLLLEIVRQSDTAKMTALVEKLASHGLATREEARKHTARPKAGRPRAFTFSYRAPTKAYALKLSFRRGQVKEDEIIEALESILAELRNARGAAAV
jgi:ParB family chromosome partitioning protein